MIPEAPIGIETDEARQLIERVARRIVGLGLAPVAVLWIESMRPMNFVGSQLLHFLSPMVQTFGKFGEVDALARALEDRRSVDMLLEAIEREESAREKP